MEKKKKVLHTLEIESSCEYFKIFESLLRQYYLLRKELTEMRIKLVTASKKFSLILKEEIERKEKELEVIKKLISKM